MSNLEEIAKVLEEKRKETGKCPVQDGEYCWLTVKIRCHYRGETFRLVEFNGGETRQYKCCYRLNSQCDSY